jgi:serine/tyrosine/threonine adenylyltransferase
MSSTSPPRPAAAAAAAAAAPTGPAGVERLHFDDSFTRSLPADPERRNFVRQVRGAAYSFAAPTDPRDDDQRAQWRLADPDGETAGQSQLPAGLIAWSCGCAELFDLSPEHPPSGDEEANVVEVLGGFGKLWPGMVPYAACYSGHQFGSWAGQLGDGRAISMGEYVNSRGERWELQLKGAGMTPYSRHADGRAVLRSSIREFLASEAMFHLGVPTTRALSLVSTGAGVVRDMFYQGDPQMENGAVLARAAPSFLRVGSFENPAVDGDHDRLKQLADYAIEYHFPELKSLSDDISSTTRNRYGALVAEVTKKNAEMVALWQGVGFVHGVLNTDNTSILGLTIDYGPYGFLDTCDRSYTPNTTDIPGRRYRYDAQPLAIRWNLHKFASAMIPLCGLADAQAAVQEFDEIYEDAYRRMFARKLGLSKLDDSGKQLVDDLFGMMEESKVDFTNTWRALSQVRKTSAPVEMEAIYARLIAGKVSANADHWGAWMNRYLTIVVADEALDDVERVKRMNKANPVYILRNYMAQEAIDEANQGNSSYLQNLYRILRNPYEEQAGAERYTQDPPSWATRPGVCVNSCSS